MPLSITLAVVNRGACWENNSLSDAPIQQGYSRERRSQRHDKIQTHPDEQQEICVRKKVIHI